MTSNAGIRARFNQMIAAGLAEMQQREAAIEESWTTAPDDDWEVVMQQAADLMPPEVYQRLQAGVEAALVSTMGDQAISSTSLSHYADPTNNDDWLGDDDYDDEGNLLPPLPRRLGTNRLPPQLAQRYHPRHLAALERRRKAVELRIQGKSFAAIAEELHFNSPQGAHNAVARAMQDYQEDVTTLRATESARIDRLIASLWPTMVNGDLDAIDRYTKLVAARIRLSGMEGVGRGPGTVININNQDPSRPPVQRIAVVEDVNVFLELMGGIQHQPQPLIIEGTATERLQSPLPTGD